MIAIAIVGDIGADTTTETFTVAVTSPTSVAAVVDPSGLVTILNDD